MRGPEGQIHYGDVIVLADVASGGFVSSGGFDGAESLTVLVERHFNPSLSVPNIADCCFQVLPKLSFTQAKSASAYLKESGIGGVALRNWHEHVINKNQDDAVCQQLLQYDVRLQEENEANAAELKRWWGQPVMSGMIVMLKHVSSSKYLVQLRYRSTVSALSFRVELHELGSKASSWKFAQTGKGTGERLYYGVQLHIENCKFANSFLSVSKGGIASSSSGSKNVLKLYREAPTETRR